ncbi:hypothetical protein F4801DRAFT_285963 [Xylaria longipes]|nr:hypothetical protein F4801DRAFT_285963 [Xylaria longipes]
MEWISQKKQLQSEDFVEFGFNSGYPCLIQTIRIRQDSSGKAEVVEEKTHTSEPQYLEWVKQIPSCPEEPTVVLVMHQRLEGADVKATSLPYGKDTFRVACEQLFQHRSVVHAIRRKSTATFTSRKAAPWKSRPEWGPAVVYNCKSDTETLATHDDIVLSVTHFPKKPIIFAVFYGCTEEARAFIGDWFNYAKASAFDPLLLPMMHSELERRRLINKIDAKGGDLRKRIIDIENRLREVQSRKSVQSSASEKDSTNISIAQRECEAVKLWVEVSSLKNGLESFKTGLKAMLENSKKPLENDILGEDGDEQTHKIRKHASERIQTRINDMIVEIESVVRRAAGHLVGMSLATQTESNYLTRKDAWATISIAVESKRDSSHMRYISFLGMIFLPGTFFATLFSMGFFNWIPHESNQIVSPWVGLYFGVTILTTIATLWSFQKWAKKHNDDALAVITRLDNEPGPTMFKPMGSEAV